MQRIFSRLSLTGKLASIVVAINVFSLAAFAFHGWSNETTSAVTRASANWSHTAEQFAEVSAGGVKWGKADVIRDGYKLYRDDPALNLVQFSALNLSGQPVDSWTRDGTSGLPAGEQLAALVKASAGKTMLDMTNASSGFVTVVAPLPKSKSGADVGFVITSWSTTAIYDAALKSALATLAFEGVFVVISVAALLFALRRMVTVPLNTIGESIKVLQQGDYRTPVPFTAKQDLIGTVARALDTFRKQMIVAGESGENARAQQRLLDEERAASARAMADSAQEQYAVMEQARARPGGLGRRRLQRPPRRSRCRFRQGFERLQPYGRIGRGNAAGYRRDGQPGGGRLL
jgi:methyl-accepting chemotaxis protein